MRKITTLEIFLLCAGWLRVIWMGPQLLVFHLWGNYLLASDEDS